MKGTVEPDRWIDRMIGTAVAMFIPTSGGQWLIQGFVTVETAAIVGSV